MSTKEAIDALYKAVADEHGITVSEVKRRAVEEGSRLISVFSVGKH